MTFVRKPRPLPVTEEDITDRGGPDRILSINTGLWVQGQSAAMMVVDQSDCGRTER